MIEKIARKASLLRYSLRASRGFKQPLGATLRRALTLYRQRRFLAQEAFDLGLLKLDGDPELLNFAVSRRYQAQVQKRVNPTSWAPLLADKGIFYRFCQTAGLPIPDLYALYFRKTPGYCPQGTPLYDPEQWARFIATQLPSEFVVKPCDSYRGSGVAGFTRTAPDEFLRHDRVAMTSRQIVDSLQHSEQAQSFVIQQRLRSHRAIAALSRNPDLQTLRIVTYIDRDLRCHILYGYLKLMTSENIFIDNICGGRTGNFKNLICFQTGTVARSYVKGPEGTGSRPISHHPVTHQELVGFPVPYWSQACDLVRRAAHALLPVRSIGWDVAVTDEGARLLEGNIWWDRCNYTGNYIATLVNDLDGPANPGK